MERSTLQKRVFKEVFDKSERPLSVREALESAQLQYEKIGQATAYRVIKDFVRSGYLKLIDLPGDGTRYERAQLPHHHFFHCRECEKVFDVPGCAPGLRQLVPRGFQSDAHELVFYGRCVSCA